MSANLARSTLPLAPSAPYAPQKQTVPIDRMKAAHYQALARMLEAETGIRLPASKQTMMESRLRKRVRARGLDSLDAYCRLLQQEGELEAEFVHLIDCVTTNKTDFFREPSHFQILCDVLLPELLANRRTIKVWSAACSIGAEAYTLAMVLAERAEALDFEFSVLGTDICTAVLEEARLAVFASGMMDPVPAALRRRYVMQARDPTRDVTRIVPELRARVRFERLNLMDRDYGVEPDFDVIFCRNILIYFSRENQDRVVERLCGYLRPGGYLVLGHAEALAGPEGFGLQQAFPTIFRRP